MTSFVISILGDDRAGLVEALSRVVTEHGGNWERSHMAQLAGKFAGVVLVTIPREQSASFLSALEPLEHRGLFRVAVEEAEVAPIAGPAIRIKLVGNDHPGIVHQFSQVLASRGISIQNLTTDTSPAPMSGGTLFEAVAEVRLPTGLTAEDIGADIETLASDLMVEFEVVENDLD
jgi:glycine cleavage system regulatory protein